MSESATTSPDLCDLSVVVLMHNRREAVLRTLNNLNGLRARGGCVIVVDNASEDGSPEAVEAEFPHVTVIRSASNAGVAGFNAGVERTTRPFVLVLDDDAMPCEGAVPSALERLRADPGLGAVALLPIDESSGACEWGFAPGTTARGNWPVMGCANVIRREAWLRVGGYEPAFFLYRNDVDLALKLLGAGYDIHFDPAWAVLHDSPGFDRKSHTWFELATRNWIWLARRHGRGWPALAGPLLGWLWAHRTSRLDWRAHCATLRGLWQGISHTPPPVPTSVNADGKPYRDLVRSRVRFLR